MPFYRLERLLKSLGVLLPASVQWEQARRVAQDLQPVYEHLITHAAQASVLFSDDTGMRVASLRKEIRSQDRPTRTGLFTTGIVGKVEDHLVSLSFTGRQHAGENLTALLDQRQAQRPPPLHMCDGLDRDFPKAHATVDCQCNVHARRGFVEVEGSFPEECRKVVESFSAIYQVEAQAKEAGLNAKERLELHRTHSQPAMQKLRSWLTELTDSKKVEPNSGLGQAIAYMQKQWTQLTQFLRVAVQTGLRNSELIRLRRQDVQLGSGAHSQCLGKGRRTRCTPLRADLAACLGDWIAEQLPGPTTPVFPTAKGSAMSSDALQRLLGRHIRTAAKTCLSLRKKRVTPHTLRHTLAMNLLQSGVDITVIALWLGHESIETTQTYLHADMAMKEKALSRTAQGTTAPKRYRPNDKLLAFLETL